MGKFGWCRTLLLSGLSLGVEKFAEEAAHGGGGPVAQSEQGDVHGRIDPTSLGISLRSVAVCLRQVGRVGEAEEWDQRAARIDDTAGPAHSS